MAAPTKTRTSAENDQARCVVDGHDPPDPVGEGARCVGLGQYVDRGGRRRGRTDRREDQRESGREPDGPETRRHDQRRHPDQNTGDDEDFAPMGGELLPRERIAQKKRHERERGRGHGLEPAVRRLRDHRQTRGTRGDADHKQKCHARQARASCGDVGHQPGNEQSA
jgi:hypothetical protein